MSSASSKDPQYYKNEITEDDITNLKKIFDVIENDVHAPPFLEPVDYVSLDLPDYPKIITHPMDLGTLRENLKNGKYKTFKDFMKDFTLIWSNCRAYNIDGSDIVKSANSLEKKMKNLIDKKFKNNKSNKSKTESSKQKNEKEQSSLSLTEKTKLIDTIREQTNESLTQIVKIILKECPKGIEDIDSEKLQIKIDLLDKRTYDIIYQYLEKNNKENNSENNSDNNNQSKPSKK